MHEHDSRNPRKFDASTRWLNGRGFEQLASHWSRNHAGHTLKFHNDVWKFDGAQLDLTREDIEAILKMKTPKLFVCNRCKAKYVIDSEKSWLDSNCIKTCRTTHLIRWDSQ